MQPKERADFYDERVKEIKERVDLLEKIHDDQISEIRRWKTEIVMLHRNLKDDAEKQRKGWIKRVWKKMKGK